MWKEFVPAWEAWWKDHEEYVRLAKQYEAGLDAGKAKDAEDMKEMYGKMSTFALVTIGETFKKAEDLLNRIVEINVEVAGESKVAAGRGGTGICGGGRGSA
jgi:hypothetical protein